MSDGRLSAAIIGLGQVGLLFDEEPERRASNEIWTHFTAYERMAKTFELVAAVDSDHGKRELAKRRLPGLNVYPTVEAMLERETLDIVSVCTPEASHLEIVTKLVGRCRGVFLEKPICTFAEMEAAEALALRVQEHRMSLRVNYYKRREPLVIHALGLLADQSVANVVVRYSGPFPAVGSHALNLMLLFSPGAELMSTLGHRSEEGDGFSGFFRATGGTTAHTIYSGRRHDLVFSAELMTDGGMISLERNLSRMRVYAYAPSARYGGYRELEFQEEFSADDAGARFVGFLSEIAGEIVQDRRDYSDLETSLATQRLMLAMESSVLEFGEGRQ